MYFDFKDFKFGPGIKGQYSFYVDLYVTIGGAKEYWFSLDTNKEDNPDVNGVVEVVPRSAEAQ